MRGSANRREDVWRHVDRSGGDDACWPWLGTVRNQTVDPRGVFSVRQRQHFAYRLVYELTIGPIPDGMRVCHTCDNGLCCNPKHLWLGTQTANLRDMWHKGRGAVGGRAGGAKLTTESVLALRERFASGESMVALAAEYGIAYEYGYAIARGRTWAWAPGPRTARIASQSGLAVTRG